MSQRVQLITKIMTTVAVTLSLFMHTRTHTSTIGHLQVAEVHQRESGQMSTSLCLPPHPEPQRIAIKGLPSFGNNWKYSRRRAEKTQTYLWTSMVIWKSRGKRRKKKNPSGFHPSIKQIQGRDASKKREIVHFFWRIHRSSLQAHTQAALNHDISRFHGDLWDDRKLTNEPCYWLGSV